MHMGKRKKGRSHGRGSSSLGPARRGGNQYRSHGYRPSPPNNGEQQQMTEPVEEGGEIGQLQPGGGVLELHPNGYGFLRDPKNNYTRSATPSCRAA